MEEEDPLLNSKDGHGGDMSKNGSDKANEGDNDDDGGGNGKGSLLFSLGKILLRNAKVKQFMLMLLGTSAAVIQGTAFPTLSVAFGNLSDNIMAQTLRTQNASLNATIHPLQQHNITNKTVGHYHLRRIFIEDIEQSPDLEDVDISTHYFESKILPHIVQEDETATGAGGNGKDNGPPPEYKSSVSFFAIYSVLIGIIAFLSSIIQTLSFNSVSDTKSAELKEGFYENVLHMDKTWFDKNKKDEVSKTFASHLDSVEHGSGVQISDIIHKVTQFVSGAGVAVMKNWPFALILMGIVPILAIKTAFTGKYSEHSRRKKVKYGRAGNQALEVFSAIRTVAAFSGEKKEIEMYKSNLKLDFKEELRHQYKIGLGFAVSNLLTYSAYALAFWAGAHILVEAKITAGTIYMILLSVMLGASELGNAWNHFSKFLEGKESESNINEVIQSKEEIAKEMVQGLMVDKIEGTIKFTNVNFKYPAPDNVEEGQRPPEFALKDINIEVEPGQMVALVGTPKSGKGTIFRLLARFYSVNSGEITIDGHPINDFNLGSLRSNLGFISSRNPFIFDGTIRENIAIGKLGSTDEEIQAAAEKALAHEFISELPEGYATMLSAKLLEHKDDDDGLALEAEGDGDEDQNETDKEFKPTREQITLILLARILLRNPGVLLLDRPILNEEIYPKATQALGAACEGRTIIVISDLLAQIQFASRIYVFNEGGIVESGTIDELKEMENGLYNTLLKQEELLTSIEGLTTEGDLQRQHDEGKVHKKSAKGSFDKLVHSGHSELEEEVEKLGLIPPTPMQILMLNKSEYMSVFLASIGSIAVGAVLPVYAVLYAEFFNTFTKSGTELKDSATFCIKMFLALAVFSALARMIQISFGAVAGGKLTMRLRINAFTGIIRQSISWFEKDSNSAEKLAKKLAIESHLISVAGIDYFCNSLTACTTIILSFIIILYSNVLIGLVVVTVAYPFLMKTGFNEKADANEKLRKVTRESTPAEKIMKHSLKNIETIQELGLEDYFYEKYAKAKQKEEAWKKFKAQILRFTQLSFAKSGLFFVYSGVFGFGSWLIGGGIIDATSLFRIFFTTVFCAKGLGSLIASIVNQKNGQFATAILLYLANLESEIDPLKPTGKNPSFNAELVVTDAHFRIPLINGLSFKVDTHTILALAGPPSSGKAMVFSLYERFYDVSSGRFLIDGWDIRDLKLEHLRRNIGLIPRNPFFFNATIRENLAYGLLLDTSNNSDTENSNDDSNAISNEELEGKIIQAAKLAMIHEFIMHLPGRYDTLIGTKGLELDDRQRQRLAFARALIRDPPILLIDEPQIVNEAQEGQELAGQLLDNACEGRTCIVIARSQYVLAHSDMVAFMANGKIVEMGSPKQILDAKGIEYDLKKRPKREAPQDPTPTPPPPPPPSPPPPPPQQTGPRYFKPPPNWVEID